MQTTDGVTDNVAPQYSDSSSLSEDDLRAFSAPVRMLSLVASWLVPGAGHLVLGRFGRAALFFFTIVGSFALGLAMHGRLFWPVVSDAPSFFHFDLISILWFFAQIGSGLCYLISFALGIGTTPNPQASTFEYGNAFMFLAGLLNYLVMHDAFDIAAGRKR